MKHLFFICLYLLASCTQSAKEITIAVEAGLYDRADCIVSVSVQGLDISGDSTFELVEITGGKSKKTPCQIMVEAGSNPVLYWVLQGETKAGSVRTFTAKKVKTTPSGFSMRVQDTSDEMILTKSGFQVLKFKYSITPPPAGVDPSFERGGYFHPVFAPSGFVLTAIQPKDHYHHFGIWNAWTRMEHENAVYDLWNIGDKQGTVRVDKILSTFEGNVGSGFDVDFDHIAFAPSGEEKLMKERLHVTSWNVDGGFLWDYESLSIPIAKQPVTMKAYRYGGFVYRATEQWTKENSQIITSDIPTRNRIDGTTARWINVTGETEKGPVSILFLGHPDNINAPQPLRIWDEAANNGRGDIMINFAPAKFVDWQLQPATPYSMRYRIFTCDGVMTNGTADRLWRDYADPPIVKIIID
ncbi:MAG: PmoA family protein [Tannerella sp.]|jgi:hypothetical protein|nr:PmoA family protein [Tannerella sp.]